MSWRWNSEGGNDFTFCGREDGSSSVGGRGGGEGGREAKLTGLAGRKCRAAWACEWARQWPTGDFGGGEFWREESRRHLTALVQGEGGQGGGQPFQRVSPQVF